jgi:hypothetical protein
MKKFKQENGKVEVGMYEKELTAVWIDKKCQVKGITIKYTLIK